MLRRSERLSSVVMASRLRGLATCVALLGASAAGQEPAPGAGTAAADATAPVASPGEVVVGDGGLLLYPRWNKLFPAVAEVPRGEVLTLLKDGGLWKQMKWARVNQSGWTLFELSAAEGPRGLKLPLAASPTTSGLVVKGYSPQDYALRHGLDTEAVAELMATPVDLPAFMAFLVEDRAVATEPPAPLPPSVAAITDAGAGSRRAAAADRAAEEAQREHPAGRLDEVFGPSSDILGGLRESKQGIFARAALEGDLVTLIGDDGAALLGQGVAARILGGTPLLEDGELQEYVTFVGLRLAEHTPGDVPSWWFAVLDGDDLNACSTAGGFVFVSIGAVMACRNEAQLAALLAHEMAHVAYRHSLLALDKDRRLLMVEHASAALDDALPPGHPALLALREDLDALGDSLHAQSGRPFDHALEHEADALSLTILRSARYDAWQAVELLEQARRNGSLDRRRRPVLPSHPSPDQRIVHLRTLLKAQAFPRGSVNDQRFRERVPDGAR